MFEFDDVELSGPLPLLLNRTFVPGTVFSVVDACATPGHPSTRTTRKPTPTEHRSRISTPRPRSTHHNHATDGPPTSATSVMPQGQPRETASVQRSRAALPLEAGPRGIRFPRLVPSSR